MKLQNYIFDNQYLDVQDDQGNMFVGRVESFNDEVITLADIKRLDHMSSSDNVPLSQMMQKEVFAFFIGHNKMKYQFRTVITRSETDQFRINLKSPEVENIIKIQNRDYLRISSSLRCDLSITQETNEALEMEVYTHDISGGGLSFYSRQPIEHHKYTGTLYLYKGDNEMPLPFKADLVYMNQVDDQRYKIALKYSDIKEQHRNHIIRYAIQEQVRFRK